MAFARKFASVLGAAAGGAFAGSGVGAVAGYTVVPLAVVQFVDGRHLSIGGFTTLILASVGSCMAVGAGLGAVRRLRRLRAAPPQSAEPGAAADTGGVGA